MSTIPLPALSVRPVQQPDITSQLSNILQLRQAAQEAPLRQQILQQQAQQGQYGVQMAAQQMKDQQALTDAQQQWIQQGGKSGKAASLDDLANIAASKGASFKAVQGIRQQALAMQEQASVIAKNDAQAGSDNAGAMVKKNSALAGAINSVLQLPDDQLAQGALQEAQSAAQQGLLDPQHLQMIQQAAQTGNPQQLRTQLGIYRNGLLNFSDQLEQQKLAATVAHNKAIEAQTAATQANTQAYRQQQLALGKARLGLEQQKNAIQMQQLGIGPQGEPSDLAKQIATGHIVPERLSYLLSRNPGLINGVTQIDPSFDSSKAQAYPAAYKDFTSGATSKQINAGAVALQHLHQLKQINDANPTEVRIPGTAPNKAYQNLLDTVADELVTFYGEPKTNEAIGSKKSTLGGLLNRDAAITEQANAMGIKLDELEQKWHNAAPSNAYQAPMPGISAAAQKARAELDPNYAARIGQQNAATPQAPSGNVTVKAPNGKTYSFKDQASANAFKQAAGIQ